MEYGRHSRLIPTSFTEYSKSIVDLVHLTDLEQAPVCCWTYCATQPGTTMCMSSPLEQSLSHIDFTAVLTACFNAPMHCISDLHRTI